MIHYNYFFRGFLTVISLFGHHWEFVYKYIYRPCYVGLLSPWLGASSGRGWKRRPSDIRNSCEYIE